MKNKVVFILGPTASGKTALAETLALQHNGEIINVDVGQFYAQLSVGTAKPDLSKSSVKQHLFDICSGTEDLNVLMYRKLVLEKIEEITQRNKRVFIVGGSLFYVKSLFYLPFESETIDRSKSMLQEYNDLSNQALWQKLAEIDPKRAQEIHHNDRYRVERALTLFYQTGELPSSCQPQFQMPSFDAHFIWLDIDKRILDQRILKRTKLMLEQGWIEEVKAHATEEWADFYRHKGLIGYNLILDWIQSEKHEDEFEHLCTLIARATSLYAKRQKTFWQSFKTHLLKEGLKALIIDEVQPDQQQEIHLTL